jgi:integrase
MINGLVQNGPSPFAEQAALAWLTAARVGCILQLTRDNVTLVGSHLTVQFRRGKGVKARGPYTVPTACPAAWLPRLTAFLATRTDSDWLWPYPDLRQRTAASLAFTRSLRAAHPALEQRSLRRGALQVMAACGVDEATLLTYSGHTNVTMLRRYLDWGRKGEAIARVARAAAAHLHSGTA